MVSKCRKKVSEVRWLQGGHSDIYTALSYSYLSLYCLAHPQSRMGEVQTVMNNQVLQRGSPGLTFLTRPGIGSEKKQLTSLQTPHILNTNCLCFYLLVGSTVCRNMKVSPILSLWIQTPCSLSSQTLCCQTKRKFLFFSVCTRIYSILVHTAPFNHYHILFDIYLCIPNICTVWEHKSQNQMSCLCMQSWPMKLILCF